MDTYLLSVEGLHVEEEWTVGPVRLLPAAATNTRVDELALLSPEVASGPEFAGVRGALGAWTGAEVVALDLDGAVDLARDALAVLRVFHEREKRVRGTPAFGLPGQVPRAGLHYVSTDGTRVVVGYSNQGKYIGFTLTAKAHERWCVAEDLLFAAAAIGVPNPSEGARRALLGCRLLSEAALEHRPDLKVLAVVRALEVIALDRSCGSQTYRLARRLAFLSCGRPDGALCGRERPTCPYLALDPGTPAELCDLQRLLKRSDVDVRWRCSEWRNIIEWYGRRSAVVHAGDALTTDEAHKIEYWTMRYVAPSFLEWLAAHPVNPIEELDGAIAALPPQPDWEAVIAAAEPEPA
jgi:hypothetical protein